ncbi:MAG: AAA family ATPase, partial [Chloroflexota bacterium]
MGKLTWAERLKRFRQQHEEQYARVLMTQPGQTTLLQAVPNPGVVLMMGKKGAGKSATAHKVAESLHKSRKMPAILHLPGHVPDNLRRQVQRLLPDWMKVVTSTESWPTRAVVIVDEAAQSAHARRTQSKDAVELDALMSISRQKSQVILFVSHHSRKLDPNIVRDADRIWWKEPTYAHWMFERNELEDFVLKALELFQHARPRDRTRLTLNMDFHNFTFSQ